jgi:VWFA-related protein
MRRYGLWLAVAALTAAGAVSLSSQVQRPAPAAKQQPTFRAGVNYVRVDVYPTRDGRTVPDLRPDEFELREDGVPQKLDSVRYIDPGPPTPQAVRVEPNSVRESWDAAADPRARLFVIFVDTYHTHWTSTYKAHIAFVEMLGQSMGEHDVVGVMTPEMSAAAVTFGRRTTVIEETLQRHFELSRTPDTMDYDDEDRMYLGCYGPDYPAGAMISRRHETLTLDALKDLVNFVGGIREERKTIFFLSDGWEPTGVDERLEHWSDGVIPSLPKPHVGPDGKLRAGGTEFENGGKNRHYCDQQRIKLAGEDHQKEFQRLLDLANRANASFYSVDLRGLTATVNARAPVGQEMLKTLSSGTDGTAVVDRNDLAAGVRRAMEDMRGYYLIGYYSSNTKTDGTYRSIKVNVKRPGVAVRARRGYLAVSEKELKEAAAAASASPPPSSTSPPGSGSTVADALSALSRIRREAVVSGLAGYTWRAGNDGAARASIWVAGEFDATSVARNEQWDSGADVSIDVTGPGGPSVESVRQALTRDSRSFVVRLPAGGAVGPGAYDIRMTSRAAGATLGTTETLRVVVPGQSAAGEPLVGQATLFRRGPYSGPSWAPVADLRFRRQERVKIEAAVVGPITSAAARLLDRSGNPLPLPVVSSQRDEDGARIVSGEVALAPLTAGDYLLEIIVTNGSVTRRELAAFRIVP